MTFGGTNLGQGHAYNRRLVLEAIRVHGALSRADLTRLTGLAPQTITDHRFPWARPLPPLRTALTG
jgi:hypothetical protein